MRKKDKTDKTNTATAENAEKAVEAIKKPSKKELKEQKKKEQLAKRKAEAAKAMENKAKAAQQPVKSQPTANKSAEQPVAAPSKKKETNSKKISRKLRLEAYDRWLAMKISGGGFIDNNLVTHADAVAYDFSYMESPKSYTKLFMITNYPNYLAPNFLDELRMKVLAPGVKMNYYMMGQSHIIPWDSAEMRNKVNAWKKYTQDVGEGVQVWDYRESKREHDNKMKLIESTLFLNRQEIDQQRTTCKCEIYIQLVCEKGMANVTRGNKAVATLLKQAKIMGVKIKPLKMNIIDWVRYIMPFSNVQSKEITTAGSVFTDDLVAAMAGYKQGRIGDMGIPVGLDIKRREAVLYEMKSDPNKVENWLISAKTGGGKSYFVKSLLLWLLGYNYTVTILDYEGDEYTQLYEVMHNADPNSAVMVSMGKGSAMYIEPMEIPDLVGDPDIDDDLKDTAQEYTLAMFRIIVHGTTGQLTRWEEGVINRAITNVYDEHLVTNDKTTWHRSKGIRIKDVYENIARMVESKEFFDEMNDNIQHKAACEIVEAGRAYFDQDGARAAAFSHPLSLTDLRDAQLIIFSFGVKGAVASSTDQSILALKQLSVANISSQISNYCKYVKHGFNVKVWEEYQRYGEVAGSAEIIGNSMTGGRKRGDINMIITNDLENILNDANPINSQIRQSISTYCIGKITSTDVVDQFCDVFKFSELRNDLYKLAGTNNNNKSLYSHAFCVIFDDGKKAIVKSLLPKELAESKLFSTGVRTADAKDKDKDKEKADKH